MGPRTAPTSTNFGIFDCESPPSEFYLVSFQWEQRVQSISGTIMNVLTALGVMYEGVREILPFVRYFSQYIDFEFNTIKAKDHGKGVICSATW